MRPGVAPDGFYRVDGRVRCIHLNEVSTSVQDYWNSEHTLHPIM